MSNRWIKCGLPWSYYGDYKDSPQPPSLRKEIKKQFGTTEDEAYKELSKLYKFDTDGVSKEFKAAQRKYKKFCDQVRDWIKTHPAWIGYQEAIEAYDKELRQKSFTGRELNRPGTLVEILDNKELKQFLIGDINNLGGVCDDCMGFSKDAIVVRYKVER